MSLDENLTLTNFIFVFEITTNWLQVGVGTNSMTIKDSTVVGNPQSDHDSVQSIYLSYANEYILNHIPKIAMPLLIMSFNSSIIITSRFSTSLTWEDCIQMLKEIFVEPETKKSKWRSD
jgi:hypothetical protein